MCVLAFLAEGRARMCSVAYTNGRDRCEEDQGWLQAALKPEPPR